MSSKPPRLYACLYSIFTSQKARTQQRKKEAAAEAAARAASALDTESYSRLSRLRCKSHPPEPSTSFSTLRRHPLLHADYLTWKDESMRREKRPRNASGSVRRLPNRKEVMAQNAGTASDVSLSLVCIAEGNRLLMTCHVDLLTTYLSSWKGTRA